MILIVTNQQDLTADLVIVRLQELGLSFLRFNTEDFPSTVQLIWTLNQGAVAGKLTIEDRSIDLESIVSIWYRRPLNPRAPAIIGHPTARAFAERESLSSLQNIWPTINCLWVSKPESIRQASSKLEQLRIAHHLGLEVPKTLVTTVPEEARAFCMTHADVIAKTLSRPSAGTLAGESFILYTSRIEAHDLERLATVSLTPTLFQSLVPRKCDLRVTLVGSRVFATEIHTPAEFSQQVDWRRARVETLVHIPHELPERITEILKQYLRHYGLMFGAFDFLITPDGQYVFLELNPNGQWAWLEQAIGSPISYALAEMLGTGVSTL
jgi:hypothetical protein